MESQANPPDFLVFKQFGRSHLPKQFPFSGRIFSHQYEKGIPQDMQAVILVGSVNSTGSKIVCHLRVAVMGLRCRGC